MNEAVKTVSITENQLRLIAGVAACMVFMVAAGPFGQAERFPLSQRVGLWGLYVLIGLPVLWAIHAGLCRRWHVQGRILKVARGILSALIASGPVLLVVEAVGLAEGRPLPETAGDYGRALFEVSVLVMPFALLLEQYRHLCRSEAEVAVPVVTAEAMAREFGEVYAICAEGHYTRVFTAHGERFVDRPFSDMLKRAAPLDGRQVHRSWWVARTAVEASQRKGSSVCLTIRGGGDIPVARRRLAQLRKAGWDI